MFILLKEKKKDNLSGEGNLAHNFTPHLYHWEWEIEDMAELLFHINSIVVLMVLVYIF